ncbi:MAG TPA: succinate dehydrogenase iron-sulfur subunit [Pyrinomonadaceae bacterium]|nr:succinate dehydrogenase iron-sulfur subunit [Pyrinomonadaceae bacterium]
MSTHAEGQTRTAGTPPREVVIRIRRRDRQDSAPYWQEFAIPHRPNLNVISALMEIRKNPVTRDGQQTTPPVWDMNCLEQVCGICTMVINGRVRQACSALVDQLEQPITLEPMSKFPNVRDLIVDRSEMFEHLKRVKAWIEIDGSHDLGPGPRMDQADVMERYAYSRCMTCGCCLEACPQYGEGNYIGPQAIAQVRYQNMHPSGKMTRDERLEAIMGDDGITNCGNSQNCVRVCPMSIPLTKAIYEENRETVLHGLFGWLKR